MTQSKQNLIGYVLSSQCPSREILEHLTSKWAVLVLRCLSEGVQRFSQLRKRIDGVSEKMLTQTLRDLESDGFIVRKEYAVIPPHVEYSLSAKKGIEVAEKIYDLVNWIEKNTN